MGLFLEIIIKLLPIYIYAGAGFILGRKFKINKNTIANILVFFILPFIAFHGVFTINLDYSVLSLPFLFFFIASFITLIFYFVGKFAWGEDSNTKNLLAFASSLGNFGYFAVPAAGALFGGQAENIVIIAGFGFVLYYSTVGYFVTALGNFTIKDSIKKTLSLPTIYFFVLGLILNAGFDLYNNLPTMWGIDFRAIYDSMAKDLRGTYALIGMMFLGFSIAELKHFKIDWKFVSLTFLAQFLVWPIVTLALLTINKNYLHFYTDQTTINVIFLLSLIPIGVNLVAFATQLKIQPEKATITILLSTIFAIFYVPLGITLFLLLFH
jgi:malate permease and related proteins